MTRGAWCRIVAEGETFPPYYHAYSCRKKIVISKKTCYSIFTVKYKKITKTNGIYSDENGIDLGFLFDLQDGIYKMTFEFKDRGGNSLSYPSGKAYYFAVDKTAPDVPTPFVA